MSERPWPNDALSRQERIDLIQANLQRPQVHHASCICRDCKPPQR